MVGRKYRLLVKKIGINGEGIAYINKTPVFIPKTLEGEYVEVEIIKNNSKFLQAKLLNVITKSKKRIKAISPNEYNSGAFPYLICDYEESLRYKVEFLKESLIKYADLELGEISIHPSDEIYNYRNFIKLPFQKENFFLVNGLYLVNSNIFKSIPYSSIHSKLIERIRLRILSILNKHELEAYNYKIKKGLRTLVIRDLSEKLSICLVTGNDKLDQALIDEVSAIDEVISIYQNINTTKNTIDIFGKEMIHLYGTKNHHFEFMNLKLQLSINSFFQLNTNQASNLFSYVKSIIPNNLNNIVELFCGIGVISLLLHNHAQNIYGIEINDSAIQNAKKNAKLNNITNIKFLTGDSTASLKRIAKKQKLDLVIVDPPRTGLDIELIENLIKSKVKQILYISCNPATLAKDLDYLLQTYDLTNIKAFDMFPQTSHVETVVLMSRATATKRIKY